MAISLKKGQKVDLTKTNPGLKNVLIGLGWDTNKYDGGKDFDLDSSVFLLGASGKVASDDDFVFYGNLKHKSVSVQHLGDNLTGAGEGDDEEIKIDLSKVPAEVEKIDFNLRGGRAQTELRASRERLYSRRELRNQRGTYPLRSRRRFLYRDGCRYRRTLSQQGRVEI